MKKILCLLTIIFLFTKIKNKEEEKKKNKKRKFQRENTLILVDDFNFERVVKHYKSILLFITSETCGQPCESRQSDVIAAAIELYKHKPRLNIGKVIIERAPLVKRRLKIIGTPDLLYIENGYLQMYTGTYTPYGIYRWMIKKNMPPLTELNSVNDIANFKNTHEVTIVYFGNDETIIKYLNDTSRADGLNFYGTCNKEEIFNTYNVKKDTIVLFKGFGVERTEYFGKITLNGLHEFIQKYSTKKVMRMDEESFKVVWEDLNPGLIIVYDKKSQNAPIYANIVKQLGEKLYGRIKIIESGIYTIIEKQLLPQINLTSIDVPAVRLTNTSDIRRPVYEFKGAITVENVIKFVDDWENGKLYPIMLSESIPNEREQERNKIFRVVCKSFAKEILNYEKSSIVFIYIKSDDNKTKNAFNDIENINDYVVGNSNMNSLLRIVQIDGFKNDVWDMKCKKYPCIFLMKNEKDNKKIKIQFTDAKLNYNSIAKFINQKLNFNIPIKEENLDNKETNKGDL